MGGYSEVVLGSGVVSYHVCIQLHVVVALYVPEETEREGERVSEGYAPSISSNFYHIY